MSFLNCIKNALEEGFITQQQADDLRARFGGLEEELIQDYGPEAGPEAARRVFDELKFETLEARRRKLLQARAAGARLTEQKEFRNYQGEEDPGEYAVNVIESVGSKGGTSALDVRNNAVRGQAHALMADAILKFERGVRTVTRNKVLLDDMGRAGFGEVTPKTPKEAVAFADAWSRASEYLRKRYNAAGGHIAKLENWGFPQSHDPVAIAKAGLPRWKAATLSRLKRSEIIDAATGRVLSDGELEIALNEVYASITQSGYNKITPSGVAGGKAIANRRSDHRFLRFDGYDNWKAYQEEFGEGDLFGAMMGHIDLMSRDIAAMEILGPNPRSTLTALEQAATKWAKKQDADHPLKGVSRTSSAGAKIFQAKASYDLYIGTANAPANRALAIGFRQGRNLMAAALLGKAIFSAFSDAWFRSTTRLFNGLPGTKHGLDRIARMMTRTDAGDRRLALHAGFVADGASQVALAAARYVGEVNATGFMGRMTDFVLRSTGLSPWTQVGRWTFGLDFIHHMANQQQRSLADLKSGSDADQIFVRTLEAYDLAGSWEVIRRTQATLHPNTGLPYLMPPDLARRTDIPPERAQYLADRYLEMIHAETNIAVPTASIRARAVLTGGTQAGTIAGEVLRSTALFKSFSATAIYQISSRSMEAGVRAGGIATGAGVAAMAGYAFPLMAGLTLFGALRLQMGELANGRDVRTVKDGKFWGAAALYGGGLGIFGDFVFTDRNRYGGGFAQTLAGPLAGFANDALNLTVGNAMQTLSGDDPEVLSELVEFTKRYAPGSNMWYAQLGLERLGFDQLQAMVDEDADERFRRRQRYYEREYGNEYYWPPGEVAPERRPDLGRALDEAPQ